MMRKTAMDRPRAQKVSPFRLAAEAFSTAGKGFLPALSASGLPLAASVGLMALASAAGGKAAETLAVLAFPALFVGGLTAASVTVQARAAGVDVPLAPGALFAKARFWGYLAASAGYALATLLAGAVAAAVALSFMATAQSQGWTGSGASGAPAHAEPVMIAAFLAGMAWAAARLVLVLPGLAAGTECSVGFSWRRTRGNAFRIALALAVAWLPAAALQHGVALAGQNADGLLGATAAALGVAASAFVQSVLLAAAGAEAYRTLAVDNAA